MTRHRTATLFPAITLALIAAPASAACVDDSGYLYMRHSCVQERVSWSPQNICEVSETARGTQTIVITSNVIFDDARNRRYPGQIFFDEMKIRLKLSANGRESHCFRTRGEAEDDLRRYLAGQRRSWGNEARFITLSMPNS